MMEKIDKFVAEINDLKENLHKSYDLLEVALDYIIDLRHKTEQLCPKCRSEMEKFIEKTKKTG